MAYCAITNVGCARSVDEWHVHYNKKEYFIVVSGKMELAIKSNDGVGVVTLDADSPTLAVINEDTCHALRTIGDSPATIIVLTDKLYDPEDELRIPFVTWSW
jgi:mannose-6-phosphate isomerase-like protein (cupin superfamily)